MIDFKEVTFTRGERTILNSVSFSINRNERVAILGGSGEGKTTILKLTLRLLYPDSGSISIGNENITNKSEAELRPIRRKFSIVFQDGALFDSLSVKENVAFYLREYTKMSEPEIEKRVRELLNVVDLENAMSLMPEELSGGMQRRVAIARSLATQESEMFLYDEPTSDLDPVNATTIRKLILDLSIGGNGFVIVTHEILDALQLADRFLFLKNGSILFDGGRESFVHTHIPELRDFISQWRSGMS